MYSNTHRVAGPFKKTSLFLAMSAVMLSAGAVSSSASAQQAPELEEVIVTGSFIRRTEGFTAASPVTQMTAEDLQAQGTVNMGQVVQNMTFNAGSAVTNTIQGTSSNTTSFNLRGLGTRATLNLMDGKRVPTTNMNVLMPSIAIQRMDILTDGAAALYGTDAVAGVVNIVPYTAYDGFRTEFYMEGDDRGDFTDTQVSVLGGTTLANAFDVVAAASFRDAGRLRWMDRPDLMRAGLTSSSNSNPAEWLVPVRDAEGNPTGARRQLVDPSCGERVDDPATIMANPYGFRFGGRCWMEYGDTRDFREANQIAQYFTNVAYEHSPDLSFSGQFLYSRQVIDGRSSTSNPGGRSEQLGDVRGELPGNPFRAVAGNGAELFAQPLRDGNGNIVMDGFGRPLPLRGSNGQVVLAQNQFASLDADPLGGVPFYEDVGFTVWRPLGRANTLPVQSNPDSSRNDKGDVRNYRLAFTADFNVPYVSGWEGTAFYTFSRSWDRNTSSQSYSFSAIQQGLNCDVVNHADACFNPFGVTDPRFFTSQAVMDQVGVQYRRRFTDDLHTYDLIFNGTIPLGNFQLPGGEIGAAFGYQRRNESLERIPAANLIAGDQFIGDQVLPFNNSRHVDAFLAEFAVPILDNLDLSLAVRNEEYSTGQSDTIGKIGVVYEPVDWLGLRATWGQAFIVPTMNQLDAPQQCGLTNVDDPFSDFSGFVASCSQGNPNLLSETSDSLSFGIDLVPNNDLRLSLTWSETDFVDRIVSTTTADIFRADFFNFRQATGFTGTQPSPQQLAAWVADPRSDKRIVRDPNQLANVLRVFQSDSNASTMLVRAYDMQLDYSRFFSNIGNLGVNVQATYMDTYRFQMSPDRPVNDAIGNQNGNFGAVPAIPQVRANARFTWSRDQHLGSATVRYIDKVNFDASDFAFQAAFPFSNYRSVDVIRAWTQVDAFYSYRDVRMLNGDASFTLGVRNLFDRQAQKTGMTSGVVGELQDPLGRVIYGRIGFDF